MKLMAEATGMHVADLLVGLARILGRRVLRYTCDASPHVL